MLGQMSTTVDEMESADERRNDFSVRNGGVRQAFFASVVPVGDTLVVEAQLAENCGVQLGYADRILHCTVPDIVSSPMDVALAETSARHPEREAKPVVIAARPLL